MPTPALAVAPYQGMNSSFKRPTILPVVITNTTGTAAIDVTRSAAGFTLVDGGSGALSGTCPSGSRAVAWHQVLETTSSDSPLFTFATLDSKAGTWSGQFAINAANADLDTDQELWLFFMIEGG